MLITQRLYQGLKISRKWPQWMKVPTILWPSHLTWSPVTWTLALLIMTSTFNCDGRLQTRAPVDSSFSQLLEIMGLTSPLRILSRITSLWMQEHSERVHFYWHSPQGCSVSATPAPIAICTVVPGALALYGNMEESQRPSSLMQRKVSHILKHHIMLPEILWITNKIAAETFANQKWNP